MANDTQKTDSPSPPEGGEEPLDPASCSPCFVVLAFRYGGHGNTFPIGVFPSRDDAEAAARAHRYSRGGKYDHRIYEFEAGKANDDVGHAANRRPCIEANSQEQEREASSVSTCSKTKNEKRK